MGFHKHYTDEQLLAYVDGELPWVRQLLAAQHLRYCWVCRQRTAELDRDIESVTRWLSQSWRLAPGGTAKAELRFRQIRGGYESAFAPRARQVWR
jgi:anti-sigma factor RsiW